MPDTHKLTQPYVEALFRLCSHNEEECYFIVEFFEAFLKASASKNTFHEFFKIPTLNDSIKLQVLEPLFESIPQNLKHFFIILAENSRLSILLNIMEDFIKKIETEFGLLRCKAYSAIPLSKEQEENLESVLKKKFNREISIENHIDTDIIGGLILDFGSKFFDDSVKGRLQKISRSIKGD